MGRINPLSPVVLKDYESQIQVPIPKFDENIKTLFESRSQAIWVYDCIRFIQVWGNTAAWFGTWGKKSLKEFVTTDCSNQSERNMLLNNMTLMECMKRTESFHPWTFYPDGEKPFQCVVRMSGISVNGELMLLIEIDSSTKNTPAVEKQPNIINMAHDAFKYCPSLMSIHAVDGTVLCCNIAAEAFFRKVFRNFTEEKELDGGKNWLRTLMRGVDQNDDEFVSMMDCVMRGETYFGQIRVPPFAQDCEVWHSITICQQRNVVSGENILVVTQTDVSKLHAMGKKLYEVENSTKELQKDRLVQSVSHELKTPLVGVIGLSEALIDNESLSKLLSRYKNAELEPVLQQLYAIRSSGERLLGLVNTLLDVSQFRGGKVQIEWSEFDVRSIMYDVIDEYICTTGVSTPILKELGDVEKPCKIVGDPRCFRQVLQTLVSNALKFTKHGVIKVKLDDRTISDDTDGGGGCIIVSVADQGIGIPEADQERIFELFEQGDNSATREHAGAGVGLCLAREIVQQHGGSIMVQSTVGVGSTFIFSIPYRNDMLGWEKPEKTSVETVASDAASSLVPSSSSLSEPQPFDRRVYERDMSAPREEVTRDLCNRVEQLMAICQIQKKEIEAIKLRKAVSSRMPSVK